SKLPQPPAVPHHPQLSDAGVLRADPAFAGGRRMALILELAGQALQMAIVVAIAPLLLGVSRKVKARLLMRIGPPLLQPYVDFWKLMHKEMVLAHNASWVYRSAPYVVFAVTWVAAALVPTYCTNLLFSWSADLIVIVALGLGLLALICVAVAENARIPIDNPATHLELTMVHEAMVLEYSGRHLAMIEAAAALKLVLYFSLIVCLFFPFGIATFDRSPPALVIGIFVYLIKMGVLAILLPIGETSVAKMRVFRYPVFLGSAFAAAALAVFLLFVSRGF